MNRALCASIAPGHFITFFYAVLDPASGEVSYCNAGHLPPLLATATGGVRRLTSGGMVLGIADEAAYAEGVARLGPGDALAFYTDGLTDRCPRAARSLARSECRT